MNSLSELLELATKCSRKFCRRYDKIGLFVYDECEAEAWFLSMILCNKEETLVKFETHEEPIKLFRMKIAEGLKRYFIYFSIKNISDAKRHGRIIRSCIFDIGLINRAVKETEVDMFIIIQSIMKDKLDWAIYNQLILNKTDEERASFLGLPIHVYEKRVRLIKRRFRKLKYAR